MVEERAERVAFSVTTLSVGLGLSPVPLYTLRPWGDCRHSRAAVLSCRSARSSFTLTLSLLGSLQVNGTLRHGGSLADFGALRSHGSLQYHGALWSIGSLQNFDAFLHYGSLPSDRYSQLVRLDPLIRRSQAAWLARRSRLLSVFSARSPRAVLSMMPARSPVMVLSTAAARSETTVLSRISARSSTTVLSGHQAIPPSATLEDPGSAHGQGD